MIKIGITGGIGSGKSVVSKLFELLGVPVYNSDIAAKRLTVTDATIRNGLIALLGEGIYQADTLNKPMLASYLFADAEHARRVNAIIHPRVREDFRAWCQSNRDKKLVAIESAILVESGFVDEVDRVVMVDAPLEVRILRTMQRDNATRQQVEQRVKAQMADEARRKASQTILMNDNELPIMPQVLQLIASLSQK
ncbi:MAG: dephospho-CoA kinase [Mediterranea massiliensis]|nr:dephospho-CoA kinase [Mediterranea massiliensis]